ncbi:hypothetical protein P7C70_g930, partial [Phenoliferia sp. Uapishka_3]
MLPDTRASSRNRLSRLGVDGGGERLVSTNGSLWHENNPTTSNCFRVEGAADPSRREAVRGFRAGDACHLRATSYLPVTIAHKIFSTQFDNPLRAALAIDTALATTNAISWVPSLHPDLGSRSDDSDSDEEEQGNGWVAKGERGRRTGGMAVVQVIRRGLRYIAPIEADVDPIVPLTFLSKLHEVLESYIGGPATEASLKDHFDIVLPLLEEMLASGRPLLTSTSQLKELVLPPSKAFANLANAAGLGTGAVSGIGPTGPAGASNATALISSPLPWRRPGIKHSNNEIYFDVTETLSVILSPTSSVLSGSLTGTIACRSKLSGMPDLVLSFGDPSVLDDMAAHPCVRSARWKKDKVISFVPPEGAFTLLTYLVPFPSSISAPSSKAPSNSSTPLLPFTLSQNITQGALGGTFSLALTCRSLAPLSNIKL